MFDEHYCILCVCEDYSPPCRRAFNSDTVFDPSRRCACVHVKGSNSERDKSTLWELQEVHFSLSFSFFGLHCSISNFYCVLQKNTNFTHHFDWDVSRFDP